MVVWLWNPRKENLLLCICQELCQVGGICAVSRDGLRGRLYETGQGGQWPPFLDIAIPRGILQHLSALLHSPAGHRLLKIFLHQSVINYRKRLQRPQILYCWWNIRFQSPSKWTGYLERCYFMLSGDNTYLQESERSYSSTVLNFKKPWTTIRYTFHRMTEFTHIIKLKQNSDVWYTWKFSVFFHSVTWNQC